MRLRDTQANFLKGQKTAYMSPFRDKDFYKKTVDELLLENKLMENQVGLLAGSS